MSVAVVCHRCGKGLRGGDDWAGLVASCPACHTRVKFPALSLPAAPQGGVPTTIVIPAPPALDPRDAFRNGFRNTLGMIAAWCLVACLTVGGCVCFAMIGRVTGPTEAEQREQFQRDLDQSLQFYDRAIENEQLRMRERRQERPNDVLRQLSR